MKILIKESQLKSIIKEYGNGSCDFFKDITNRLWYDEVLQNKPNRHYENLSGEIVLMTADEYLRRCASMQNVSYDYILNKIINPIQKEKVIDAMTAGIKIDLPMIDYVHKFQEGRHRVIAASELGCEKMKVAIFYKKQEYDDDYSVEFKIGDYNYPDVETDEEGTYVKVDVFDHDKIESLFGDDALEGIYDIIYPTKLDVFEGSSSSSVNDISVFDFNERPTRLFDFLSNEITNNITQSEIDYYDYDYNLGEIVKSEYVDEFLYMVMSLKNEVPFFNKLYEYLVKLFDGVITYIVKEHNDQFIYHIKDGYHIGHGTEGRKKFVKIYDNTTHTGNPNYYSSGYDVLSEYGGIIKSFSFLTNGDFTNKKRGTEIDVRVVNLYLDKFPFKK
jgi:hypothetical protein